MLTNKRTAYLAAEGFEKQLVSELPKIIAQYGNLFLTGSEPVPAFWAQNIWYDPIIVAFESISEAARALKSIQRNWTCYPYSEHRRAALIQSKLPFISEKPVQFGSLPPEMPMGSWTLLDKNTLLAAPHCSSLYGNGVIHFQECKTGPPSRAYLKLWEALTIAREMPGSGSKCLDAGASPGGWTWVLASLGCEVLAVDRSPLGPAIAAMPGVSFKEGDAFTMTPKLLGGIDWIFCDVACYPEKLLEWVLLWIESGLCKNFICTLKFQGDESYEVAKQFAEIPGSRLVHLGYNKHELTWIKCKHG